MNQTTDREANQIDEPVFEQPVLIPTIPLSLTESYGSAEWRRLSEQWEIGMFQTDPRDGKPVNLPTMVFTVTPTMGMMIQEIQDIQDIEIEDVETDEQAWARASIQSLAKYWDTPEEDAAWAHL